MSDEQKKEQRDKFLRAFYSGLDGSLRKMASQWDVGKSLNYDRATTGDIASVLVERGLIKAAGIGGEIRLTERGISAVESGRLSMPPDVHPQNQNSVTVHGDMVNSQLQQASPNAQQSLTMTSNDLSDFWPLVQQLMTELEGSKLDADSLSPVLAELRSLTALKESPEPNKGIIQAIWGSVQGRLAKLAVDFIPAVTNLLPQISAFFSSGTAT